MRLWDRESSAFDGEHAHLVPLGEQTSKGLARHTRERRQSLSSPVELDRHAFIYAAAVPKCKVR